jgi:polysaccharide biosynthesis protein PslH
MRILWVKMGGLWPSTTGGRVRSLQTISELSRRHEVTLITTHGTDDDSEGLARQLPRCRQIVSIPYDVPKRGSLSFPAAVARSWFSQFPVDLWKWRVRQVRKQADELIANGEIDLCVADFLFAAANVPSGGSVPVVLFEHNVEYLIWQRLSALQSSRWRRALFEIEWRKLRAREAEACDAADLTIAVSEDDRRRLSELAPNARVAAIPTGVDTRYFTPIENAERPSHLVFSGSMDWHPNEDAVLYFADAILPRIRSEFPDVVFSIVGRRPTDRVRALAAQPGITVSGTIDDVRPLIAEAAVYVVPLRAGGGTRLKIFEALAMGKAVVSTSVGAEGLALSAGKHFVAADSPDGFVDAVLSLLRNPGRRIQLGQAGRRLVDERYSWAQVAREFEQHCEGVVITHADESRRTNRRADVPRTASPRHGGAGVVAGEQHAVGWSHHHS